MKNRDWLWWLAVVLGAAVTSPAGASLVGDEIVGIGSLLSPSPGPVTVVDPGVEFNIPFDSDINIAVDVGDSTISFRGTSGNLAGFGLVEPWIYHFSDLDWVDNPTGVISDVSIVSSTISGFDLSDITFDDHSITLNLNNTNWVGASAGFVIGISHIPIPATLPLLGSAIAGLGFMGWRRRMTA